MISCKGMHISCAVPLFKCLLFKFRTQNQSNRTQVSQAILSLLLDRVIDKTLSFYWDIA